MIDKQLTDNEIIKALECCQCDDGDLSNCEDCPLVECKNLFVCHAKLSSNALDLINRQKAEIENYSNNNKTMSDSIYKMQKLIESQKAENSNLTSRLISLQNDLTSAKAEVDDLKRDDLPRCKYALRRANEIGMDLEKENQELKAEIEGLHKEVGYWEAETKEARADIDQAVAEAIKEFTERLNKEAEKVCIDREGDFVEANNEVYDTVYDWCKETSDNLVKEMVGDGDGTELYTK